MAAVTQMAPADAQWFWLSSRMPNDQFLIYAFDGPPSPGALEQVRRRAEQCAEATLRVADESWWRYPRWVPAAISDEQFVVHEQSVGDRGDFGAIARLGQLDAARTAWRVHLFAPAVVVVQVCHCLGDGNRSAAFAAALLGRAAAPRPLGAPDAGWLLPRAIRAARAQRDAPAPIPPRPALSVNGPPAGTPVLRTLMVRRERLRAPTITVSVLAAIGEALGAYLAERGEDVSGLGAEVPMAGRPTDQVRNNFRNVGVGLHPRSNRRDRASLIAGELDAARRRGTHPSTVAAAEAFAATPAWLLRWGIGRFDPNVRSASVTGNTVVSSVDRGPADLSFGGRPVRYTAGFPALSPMQRLTHGVHGIGDSIAVSVHADSAAVDVEDYLDRLAHALG